MPSPTPSAYSKSSTCTKSLTNDTCDSYWSASTAASSVPEDPPHSCTESETTSTATGSEGTIPGSSHHDHSAARISDTGTNDGIGAIDRLRSLKSSAAQSSFFQSVLSRLKKETSAVESRWKEKIDRGVEGSRRESAVARSGEAIHWQPSEKVLLRLFRQCVQKNELRPRVGKR